MEVTEELNSIVQDMLDRYKKAISDSRHMASGQLANTATYKIVINGKWVEIYFNLSDYWKYLELGTRPHFPPIDVIEKWITVKRIVPSNINSKVPSTRQLAYMICRDISIHGTKPTKLLQKTINESDDLIQQLIDVITKQLEQEIEEEQAL